MTQVNPKISQLIDVLVSKPKNLIEEMSLLNKQFLNQHRVLQYIVQKSDENLAPIISERIKQKTMRQTSMLVHLQKVANNNNDDLIVLKGPLLSEEYYGNLLKRNSNDIDVLVKPDSVLDWDQELLDLGFKRQKEFSSINENQFKVLIASGCELSYFHEERKILLELHWRLFRNPYLFDRNVDFLFESSRQYSFNDISFSKLSTEDELLYLMIHGGRHAYLRIQWLLDVQYVLRNCDNIVIENVYRRANKADMSLYVLLPLFLLSQYFSYSLEGKWLERISKQERLINQQLTYIINCWNAEKFRSEDDGSKHLKYHLRFRNSFKDSWYHLFHVKMNDIPTRNWNRFSRLFYYLNRITKLLKWQ